MSHDQRAAASQALGDIPRRTARRLRDKTAVIDGDFAMTFAQLDARVDALAAAFQAQGLVEGDVVACLSRNCWQMAVLPFAAARAGLIFAPINFLLSGQEVSQILELTQPKLFLVEDHLVATGSAAVGLAGQAGPTDQAEAAAGSGGSGIGRWEKLGVADPAVSGRLAQPAKQTERAGATEDGGANGARQGAPTWRNRPAMVKAVLTTGRTLPPDGWQNTTPWFEPGPEPTPVQVSDHDVIRLMFTSGTEAKPKAVRMTSRALMWQYMSTIVGGSMTQDDIELHVMPLYHCAQLDVFLIPDVLLGATSVILPSGGPGRVQKAIQAHGVNKLFATPSKWIELLHSPAFDPAVMGQLTKGYYGAAAMPVPILREMDRVLPALRLWNFYGQTEMAPAACILPPEDQLSHAGSAGQPAINVEMAILDPDGRELEPGQVGEVAFRSAHACLGYLADAAATDRLFRGGWLHTGDLGYLEDGRLYFVDRVKDTINVGGEKVSSREVEEVIYQLDGVHEAAVFAAPHPKFLEMVVAAVVPKEGHQLDPEAVMAHVRSKLAGFKTPRRVVVLDSLPKNASGKILKRELRAQFSQDS
ncbi:MAG: AMP-binding protein [Micrococcales bacterium]|nr:AMP-binding protein [Micrococcales bacterium]